jgi:predicted RNA-binding Zn-ribbon protein involved in translation (DUF1610 family)
VHRFEEKIFMPTLDMLEVVAPPAEACSACGAHMEVVASPGPRRHDYQCPACGNQKSTYVRIAVHNTKNNREHTGFLIGKTKPIYINHVLYHQMTLEIAHEAGADLCRDLSARLAYGRKAQVIIKIDDGRNRDNVIFLFNRGWMEDEWHTTIVLEEVGRSVFD